MLKKTIKTTNLDGRDTSETHYFNLTTAELVKLNLEEGEGFQDYLTKIVEAENGKAIVETFDKLVGRSYGVRTLDGKFIKRPEDYEAFKASQAYSDFFVELVTDGKKMSEFVNAIMPADLVAKAAYMQQQGQDNPKPVETHNVFDQPNTMSDEDLLNALGAEPVQDEFRTEGLTDDEIRALKPSELRQQPRPVLLRAMHLKNQK